MKKQPLRVGFDLDGVILYNPVRIVRPIIAFFKNVFLHKKELIFYYPKSPVSQWFWKLFHKSSIFISPGVNDLKMLVKQKKIKAYIVTARYDFLGSELKQWVKKNKFNSIFSGIYYNSQNKQPHFFKENMIKKLDLDVFVEDNWDIVDYLSNSIIKTRCSIYWIYNIFDRGKHFPNKFPFLQKAVYHIKNDTK